MSMNFFEFYGMGGPYMHPITLMGIIVLAVSGYKIYQKTVLKVSNDKWLGLIRMAGLFAVTLGILSQIVGIIGALQAIQVAGDVSPTLVMAGAEISFYSTIWGMVVLLFSLLCYYILKEVVRND